MARSPRTTWAALLRHADLPRWYAEMQAHEHQHRTSMRGGGEAGGARRSRPTWRDRLEGCTYATAVVLRPQLRSSMLWQLAVGGLLLLFVALARSDDVLRSLMLVSLLVAFCLGVAVIAMRTASLRTDASGLVSVNVLGRTTRLPREHLTRGERYSVRGLYAPTRYLLLQGLDGSPLLNLSGNFWDLAAVEELCAREGVTFTGSYCVVRSATSTLACYELPQVSNQHTSAPYPTDV